MPDESRLLLVAVVVGGAAALKGAVGFGFPLVAVPLLSSLLGPRTAVPVIAIPTLLSNIIMVSRGGASQKFSAMLPLFVGVVVGTLTGALLIKSLDPRRLGVLVGSVTLLYVVASISRLTLRIRPAAGVRAAPAVGVLAGVIGGSTGIFAPPLASYLHLLGMEKRDFVFWITLLFFVGNMVQVGSYFHLGLYTGSVLRLSLLACLPMALGTWLGLSLQDRLSSGLFSRIVLVIVGFASLNVLAQAILH